MSARAPQPGEPHAPHEQWMREAIAEAEKARGRTHPNPIVGALVVKDRQVLGRGHHERAGAPHAEVVALREAGEAAHGAELYVTLEPCNHTGRTPPCTEAILAAKVARVFIGTRDPNPHVRGAGATRLREAGVPCELGVAGALCDAMNEPWIKFIETGRPWVVLKAAATLDGKIATRTGDSKWITGERARAFVHGLRDELDAVLVGINTVLQDDPRLTTRLEPELQSKGQRQPRDPVRVVVDAMARMPVTARMLTQNSAAKTLLAVGEGVAADKLRALEDAGAIPLVCARRPAPEHGPGLLDLRDLLQQLGARGLTSLLVEGGAAIHGSFFEQALWDELCLFLAPKIAGRDGISWAGFAGPESMAQALALGSPAVDSVSFAPDVLFRARRSR